MDQQQQGFLDSRTIIAVVLMGAVFFGWQSYIAKKYPQLPKAAVENVQKDSVAGTDVKPSEVVEQSRAEIKPSLVTDLKEKTLAYDDGIWKFEVSSLGMGVKGLSLKNYTDRTNTNIRLGSDAPYLPLATFLNQNVLSFEISQTAANTFTGRAQKDGVLVTKTLTVDSANYTIATDIKVEGSLVSAKDFATIVAEETFEVSQKAGSGKVMGGDKTLWQSYFVSHSGTNDHKATSEDSPLKQTFEKVSVGALKGKYFGQALVDDSSVLPEFIADYDSGAKIFLGRISYDLSGQQSADLKLKFFAGPLSLGLLSKADARLEKAVNFGMFGWLASPLLKLMKWLYGLTSNYGWAIVLMTILVRFAVLPFNIASYRSMKAMQVIQPEVNKLKEKYKDDPQTMNKEMMRIMRENNANPMMGCLPMLLQLPVFFALYQVLDHSLELYKAPFMFWIHDLSLKDPYFVLPVLMGITMFIQQKITPTTMDPAQAKILLMMPIIFTAFMLTLPSGLTLYIFISTLFGIIQQFVFMKDKSPKTTAIQAKA